MRRHHHWYCAGVLVVVAGVGAWAAGVPQAGNRGRQPAPKPAAVAHPEVPDPSEACEACHAGLHEAVVLHWDRGPHGRGGVKCFVCHGSTGADFRARPDTSTCQGCHAPQVETMQAAFMKGKTCFTCHEPHALRSHEATTGGGR